MYTGQNETISIIIPVYNVERYLDRCIQSVVQQTHRKTEIILVNDGSSDRSPDICRDWQNRDPRIKVIHQSNQGLSAARNTGLREATGSFIGFVDADDWIAPELYERLITAIYNDKSDISACSVIMIWEGSAEQKRLTVKKNCLLNRDEAQLALLKETDLKQPVWYKLYRRKTIGSILFEVGKYHEDVFWSYLVVGNAASVSLIDYEGYYYFQRHDSIMGESYSIKRLDVMEAYCKRYEYIRLAFPEYENEAKLSIVLNCIYHGQMALKYLKGDERKAAFRKLSAVRNQYRLHREDYSALKFSHRLWVSISRFSLKLVCYIKNILQVGM